MVGQWLDIMGRFMGWVRVRTRCVGMGRFVGCLRLWTDVVVWVGLMAD